MRSRRMRLVQLSSLAEVKVGFAFPSAKFLSGGNGPRLLRGINVKRGRLDWSNDNERRWGGSASELDNYLLHAGDLVIAMDGALVGRSYASVSTADLPAYLVQRVARVRARDPRSQSFLRHVVGSNAFVAHVDRVKTHTAVPHISGRDIEGFGFAEFPLTAQARLGDLFDRFVDLEIGLEECIRSKRIFKLGVLQKLLSGQVRFSKFRGEAWHHSRLGDHVREVTLKNTAGVTLVLTASGEHGLVDQRRYFNRSVAGMDLARYQLLKKGEFAYNRSAMNGFPYGATKRLDEHEAGALSTLYLCFAISDPDLHSDYLKHVFDSGMLNRQLRPIVRVGARAHGLLNVMSDDFLSISIPFPGIGEQRRVAEVANALDKEIELLGALRGAIEMQKRGLLSRLLSGDIPVTIAA